MASLTGDRDTDVETKGQHAESQHLRCSRTVSEGVVVTANSIFSTNNENLQTNFGLISLGSIGLVVGNVLPALGGSIGTAIFNGAAPGVLYEFLAIAICYFAVAATLAELASALPSSSGVYLWASVTPGHRYGRIVGYFAGGWNCLAWIFGEASMALIASKLCVQMYAYQNPGFTQHPWHVFVGYLLITWLACATVCLGNPLLPRLNIIGLIVIILGVIITIIVCVAMVSSGIGVASSAAVWKAGMLNASFAFGTPDAVSHLVEEIPDPKTNVPKALAMQYTLGFVSGFAYLIAILYCVTDYDALFESSFPIAEVYSQATGSSAAGTIGLLMLLLLPTLICTVGVYVTCGRTLWTLARDGATLFPRYLGHIDTVRGMPLIATLVCAGIVSLMGLIYLGSRTAFNAFVGSFVLLSTASYLAAILPYVMRCRRSNAYFSRGPFFMRGVLGWLVCGWACVYMLVWFVVYCFPYALPTDAQSMNYAALIWGGLTIAVAVWWIVGAQKRCNRPAPVNEVTQ